MRWLCASRYRGACCETRNLHRQLRNERHGFLSLRSGPVRGALTEYAAHLLDKDKKSVTRGELEGMKRHAKRMYYLETGFPWLVHEVVNPAKPAERKRDFTSSKTWKRGEMYLFLTWLQMKAATDGLILESRGEYAELQRQEAA